MPRYIEVDVEIKKVTLDALLVDDGDQLVWLPKSTVNGGFLFGYDSEGNEETLEVAEWMAIDRELI